MHDLLDLRADVHAFRCDVDRLGVEAGEVEQLLDEIRHALCLLHESRSHCRPLLVVEPVGEVMQRRHETMDRRHRRSQLMRCERDEVRLHLIGSLERDARLVLGLEEANAVEREPDERPERLQQPQLLFAEERRIRRRPDDDRAAVGNGDGDDARVVPQCGRLIVPEDGLHVVRDIPRRDEPALGVADCDRACADDRRRRLEHSSRHLLLRRREREQARDRLLHPRLLRCAPEDAEHLRRREREEERDHADERDALRGEREPRSPGPSAAARAGART